MRIDHYHHSSPVLSRLLGRIIELLEKILEALTKPTAEPKLGIDVGPVSACGWKLDAQPWCNLCARPYVRALYARERNEAPTPRRLAGDSRG
jgi:hypothetical protein